MENSKRSKFLVFLENPNIEGDFTPQMINEYTRQHVERLRQLDAENSLFLCGPLKDDDRGMLIINAKSYEEAENIIKRDPFIANNCYLSYTIKEIIEGNAGNNYLLEAYLMPEE